MSRSTHNFRSAFDRRSMPTTIALRAAQRIFTDSDPMFDRWRAGPCLSGSSTLPLPPRAADLNCLAFHTQRL